MLSIMAKLSAISKLNFVNTLEFLLLLENSERGWLFCHNLFCNHSSGFVDFFILASNNNDFKVTLMESLLINRDHPSLNKNRHSLSLELFDD